MAEKRGTSFMDVPICTYVMVEINTNGGQNKWPQKNIFRISINVLDLENVAKLYIGM